MKKVLLMVLTLISVGAFVFAQDAEDGTSDPIDTAGPLELEWEFSPEVSTTVGFNLDSRVFGLKGAAKFDVAATIREEANQDFTGTGTSYGYIEVEDLEIKIDAGETSGEAVADDKVDQPTFSITWGSIYWKNLSRTCLHHITNDGHGELGQLSTIDDGDLDFTTISYSVIPASYTGSWSGASGKNERKSRIKPETTADDGTINVSFGDKTNLSAIGIGYEIPDLLTIELGFSTQHTYNQKPERKAGDDTFPLVENPTATSLQIDYTGVQGLTAKLNVSTFTDLEVYNQGTEYWSNTWLEDDNSINIGALVGYELPAGDFTLTPKFATEIRASKRYNVDPVAAANATPQPFVLSDKVEREWVLPYELGLGVTLGWKDLGLDGDESDHLAMTNEKDVTVSDGASLSAVFGSSPDALIRTDGVAYWGVKLAVWDTEDGDKVGLIPGLETGLIVNFNNALGGESEDYSEYFMGIDTFKYEIDSRFDMGVGFEASYKVNEQIKPFVGVIFKKFDFLGDAKDTNIVGTLAGTNTTTTERIPDNFADRFYANKDDLRIKLGTDIDVISNTTITVEWQSGDLLFDDNEEDNKLVESEDFYKDDAFFRNQSLGGDYDNKPGANLGYISVGATISF